MKNQVRIFIIIGLLLIVSAFTALASTSIRVFINGTQVKLDVPVMLYKNRAMVPVRNIAGMMNADVRWDNNTQSIIINTNDKRIWKKNNSNENIYPAITLITRYLSLLQADVSGTGTITEKVEWQTVLSDEAQKNYGMERVWYPIPGMVGSSVRSIPKFEIIDGRIAGKDKKNNPIYEIAVRYLYIDPTNQEEKKAEYTKIYTIICQEKSTLTHGKMLLPVLDKEITIKKEIVN